MNYHSDFHNKEGDNGCTADIYPNIEILQPVGTFDVTAPPAFNGASIPTGVPVEIGINLHIQTEQRVCKNCNNPFTKYEIRNGIHVGLMIIIILLSIFMFVFLALFLCLCQQYRVCPNCKRFTGDSKSNEKNICLC